MNSNVYMNSAREKPFTWAPYTKPFIVKNSPINHKSVLIVEITFQCKKKICISKKKVPYVHSNKTFREVLL